MRPSVAGEDGFMMRHILHLEDEGGGDGGWEWKRPDSVKCLGNGGDP